MSMSGSRTRSFSSVSVRRISPAPGRKTSSEPGSARKPRVDRVRHLLLDARARIAAEIARLDRKAAALALDHRRIAKQRRHPRAIERRRHHQQLQILAQALLRVARQRQAEIGIERALVEFVEQHGGDAVERGIVEDQPREHAFGHHLDAGALARPSSRSARASPRCRRPARPESTPCGRRRRARRAGAAPARGFSCPSPRAHRAAPAARAWSCRRRAAPPARRRCAPPAPRSVPAARRRWEGVCRSCASFSSVIIRERG